MWIYVWDTEIKWIYLWDTPVKEVYLWDTKIRPSAMPAWIYHNAALGLISLSSDGSNWITIADKNLWATTVWNSWDALSETNCWKYYQRWNNYWFPYNWATSTSSTRVNAQNYWPWNYYSNSIFRTTASTPYKWDTSDNANLWWWTTNTNEARRWPCASWFHIPSNNDIDNLVTILTNLWQTTSTIKSYLKLPICWQLSHGNWTSKLETTFWYYRWSNWSSSWNYSYMQYFTFWDNYSARRNNSFSSIWIMIRPFKNEAATPDGTWTVLYQPS